MPSEHQILCFTKASRVFAVVDQSNRYTALDHPCRGRSRLLIMPTVRLWGRLHFSISTPSTVTRDRSRHYNGPEGSQLHSWELSALLNLSTVSLAEQTRPTYDTAMMHTNPSVCMHACMQEDFEAAAERIKPVTGPNNDEMLECYGLYKQATVGDNNTREQHLQAVAQPWTALLCLYVGLTW